MSVTVGRVIRIDISGSIADEISGADKTGAKVLVRVDAGVDDINASVRSAVEVVIHAIEGQWILIDSIEAPRWRVDLLGRYPEITILFHSRNARVLQQPVCAILSDQNGKPRKNVRVLMNNFRAVAGRHFASHCRDIGPCHLFIVKNDDIAIPNWLAACADVLLSQRFCTNYNTDNRD